MWVLGLLALLAAAWVVIKLTSSRRRSGDLGTLTTTELDRVLKNM